MTSIDALQLFVVAQFLGIFIGLIWVVLTQTINLK